jgi:hypothetical protein
MFLTHNGMVITRRQGFCSQSRLLLLYLLLFVGEAPRTAREMVDVCSLSSVPCQARIGDLVGVLIAGGALSTGTPRRSTTTGHI